MAVEDELIHEHQHATQRTAMSATLKIWKSQKWKSMKSTTYPEIRRSMPLDWTGWARRTKARLEAATAAVIAEGKVRTYDMGGTSTTLEMGEAIARKL